MDIFNHSKNNAKVSDSAYSNSCNSQSRRSHSSKSTHSGSNSSGSSGYGGKATSAYSSNNQSLPAEKRSKDKELKKKKPPQSIQTDLKVTEVKNEIESISQLAPVFESSKEDIDVVQTPSPGLALVDKGPELMEVSDNSIGKDELTLPNSPVVAPIALVTSHLNATQSSDGFSCVISMQDGVVMYSSASITTALGYPKELWIGRSFIDFVHQRDRNAFASQITSGIVAPKNVDSAHPKAPALGELVSTMICRIRRFKGLNSGFGIKEKVATFMPFLLKFFFKSMIAEDKEEIYLVIDASPFFSAFKIPNEIVTNPIPFVMRHAPNGKLDYIDPESVPYLGYLPQDIVEKDALQLYCPNDLMYLRQVYETIVKEGSVERSKPYRMMAQNGDYLKLETEWSSFTNPWSRKLEFVIGKHFIIEGPRNPDVFQTPLHEKDFKIPDDEEAKGQAIRESMIRILNEVLTKPAEMAKQQMSKRCQDLALFMESLLEDTPKPDEELTVEIQDADHSCFERDSVMLGGISPHHDYNDSYTSVETLLTYNQINYNENLQRFFDTHEPYTEEDKKALALCENANIMEMEEPEADHSKNPSPVGEIDEMASSSDSSAAVPTRTSHAGSSSEYQSLRLTSSLINKHNIEMEKELAKTHRETRSSKGERERASNESRQKMKEHLSRCNAVYHPTNAGLSGEYQPQGLKRHGSRKPDEDSSHKHHCSSQRYRRRCSQKPINNVPFSATNNVPSPWPSHPVNNINPYVVSMGIPTLPTQMPVMNSMGLPAVMPMYYAQPTPYQMPPRSDLVVSHAQYHSHSSMSYVNAHMQYHQSQQMNFLNPNNVMPPVYPVHHQNHHPNHQMQCMMMGQPIYGSPYLYSPVDPYAAQQTYTSQQTPNTQPLGLANRNFEEACKRTMPPKPSKSFNGSVRREEIAACRANKAGHWRDIGYTSVSSSNRNTDNSMVDKKSKMQSRFENSDGANEKTDGESSYSSFYSSFFKTDSGSNEESDSKSRSKKDSKASYKHKASTSKLPTPTAAVKLDLNERKIAKRKIQAPWMEQVNVSSELMYKYQIVHKNSEEVLSNDKDKLQQLEQSDVVCEQLSQLYLDLQLQGVAARVTLEEGITSSSSSGEDSPSNPKPSTSKPRRRNREYSRLVMIYEEDAPMPTPQHSSDSSTSS